MEDLRVTPKVIITTEEYRELVEESAILDRVIFAYQNCDKYDLEKALRSILRVDSYEKLKERKEELRVKLAQARIEEESEE